MASEPSEYVLERVREALASDPRVGELHVEVTVVGDRLYLAGTVPTEARRDAIDEVVREVAPDLVVASQIAVEGISGEPGREELP
jgi:hypothetical protein